MQTKFKSPQHLSQKLSVLIDQSTSLKDINKLMINDCKIQCDQWYQDIIALLEEEYVDSNQFIEVLHSMNKVFENRIVTRNLYSEISNIYFKKSAMADLDEQVEQLIQNIDGILDIIMDIFNEITKRGE